MTVVVSDTSVLCYLALIGRLNLLESLFNEVVIPEVVWQECLHSGAPALLRLALAPSPPFITVANVGPCLDETVMLDPGEAAAITLAWQHRSDSLLLIDERRGRAIASALGLRLRGILGIVAEAHRRGIVDFDETMSQLRQHGFRIADALLSQARAQLGLQA